MNIDKFKGGIHGHILLFKNIDVEISLVQEPIDKRAKWKAYRRKVQKLTELVADRIEGIETRGFKDHHIDHIVSIWEGFKLGMPEEDIATLSNLRMLPYKENMLKGTKPLKGSDLRENLRSL